MIGIEDFWEESGVGFFQGHFLAQYLAVLLVKKESNTGRLGLQGVECQETGFMNIIVTARTSLTAWENIV